MSLDAIRLTLRLHRFEIAIFGALAILGIALTYLFAAELDAVGYTSACLEAMQRGEITPRTCEFKANEFYGLVNSRATILVPILGVVPYAVALLIGVALVGREIERGTTRLAWSLTPSRMRWFAQRLLPVLVVVALIGLVLGAAADRWLAATEPGIDPANAFAGFGSRGPVLAARALFVFALAIAVGSLLGRALPALIAATIIAVFGIAGGSNVHDRIIHGEAIVIDDPQSGDRWIDQQFRLPDGRLIGWEEVERYDPPPTEWDETTEWPTLPQVAIGIPGQRYGEVALREIGALGGGTLGALFIAGITIHRRRPG